MSTYDSDFYTWTQQQAALLRAGRAAELDWSNVAEEIEGMGNSQRDQLTSRLGVLLAHLLKWDHQPGLRGNSWRLTIREQRRRIARVLQRNPGLKGELDEIMADAHGDALLMAERETGLAEFVFPQACPWSFDQAMRADIRLDDIVTAEQAAAS